MYLLNNLKLALLYMLAQYFGLMLAVEPDFATVFYPAAGVALAGLLLGGSSLWPGLFFGALVINLWTQPFQGQSLFLASLSFSIGSTLQALAGVWLIKRFIGYPNALDDTGPVAWLCFFLIPLSCLVSTGIGVPTLWMTDKISTEMMVFSWWTWWTGDTIGVFLILPLVLIWRGQPREIWQWRKKSMPLPLIISATLVVMFVYYAELREGKRLELEFHQGADILVRSLDTQFDRYREVVWSLEGFFSGSEMVSRQEFQAFVKRPLYRHPGIQALSWNPLLRDEQRASFEERIRREGVKPHRIVERGPSGELIPAARRPEYVVVKYIEPIDGNEKAILYDIASNPNRLESLSLARDSGEQIVTPPLTLVQDGQRQSGVLLLSPVYRVGVNTDTKESRRRHLLGFGVGVFRMDTVLKTALEVMTTSHLNHFVAQLWYDSAVVPRPVSVYARRKEGVLQDRERVTALKDPAGFQVGHRFDFGGRQWRLILDSTQNYRAAHRSYWSWLVLGVGVLFLGFVLIFLLVATGRTFHIHNLAAVLKERTTLLEKTNLDLNRAMEQRIEAEKRLYASERMAAVGRLAAGMAHEVNNPLASVSITLEEVQMVVREHPDPPDIDHYLEVMERNLKRASRIVTEVLTFASQGPADFAPVSLNRIIESALEVVEERLKPIDLQLALTPVPEVMGIFGKLEQVYLNLLANALDAMPDGGTLRITSRHRDDWVITELTDSGHGIAVDMLPKVFDPFFTTKPVGRGTGLGLSVCYGIITQHQGVLELNGSEEEGTRASIRLPVHKKGSS